MGIAHRLAHTKNRSLLVGHNIAHPIHRQPTGLLTILPVMANADDRFDPIVVIELAVVLLRIVTLVPSQILGTLHNPLVPVRKTLHHRQQPCGIRPRGPRYLKAHRHLVEGVHNQMNLVPKPPPHSLPQPTTLIHALVAPHPPIPIPIPPTIRLLVRRLAR